MQAELARLDPKALENLPKDLKDALPKGLPGLGGGDAEAAGPAGSGRRHADAAGPARTAGKEEVVSRMPLDKLKRTAQRT